MNAGIVLFGTFAICLIVGVPISISLGVASTATIMLCQSVMAPATFNTIVLKIYQGLDSVSIMAIAFFVLAGNLMTKGGISRRIVNFVNDLIGNVRGGMAVVLIISCAFFAALSGSAPATVIAIGSMLYGSMAEQGYPKERTAGLLVVSGGLGPIIPPSIIMVIYGTITGASIGSMFKQGMLIGIIIMVTLIGVALFYANKEQWPKDSKKISGKELLHDFLDAIPALMTPIIILGGIYSGLMTPTESSVAACIWALIAGLLIYRELNLKEIYRIFFDSAKSAAMILFIIATSTAFSYVFTFSGTSKILVQTVVGWNLNTTMFCFVVAIILLIFGTFMEGTAIAVLLVPVLWPIAQSMGVNVIHFGMIVCISNVIGTMTPPVAVNIFSASTVSGLKMGDIAKGEIPFLIGYMAVFFLTVFVPWFSVCLL